MRSTIKSEGIEDLGLHLSQTSTLNFGDRQIALDDESVIQLSDDHTRQLAAAAVQALGKFGPLEDTLATRLTTGLPTLLARVDCTIADGEIRTYEVEERPAGMGVTSLASTQVGVGGLDTIVRSHMEDMAGRLPIVLRHTDHRENDDEIIFSVHQLNMTARPPDAPILVRSEPEDMMGHPYLETLQSRSVSTVMEKGKRAYRLATGDAFMAICPSSLSVDQSIVVKSLQGSKTRGVDIYLSTADRKTLGGRLDSVSFEAVRRAVSNGPKLLEEFKPGIEVNLGRKRGRMILRVFVLVGLNGDVEVTQGSFVARPGHLIHGKNDALMGVVLPAQGVKL